MAAADGEGEPTAARDRSPCLLGHDRRPPHGDGGGVGKDLDPRVRYEAFSSWPPNCLRIAERTFSANSSSPREAKRE